MTVPESLTAEGLLQALQIADSLFPTGSFTQSYGLETYVQEGVVCSSENLRRFMAMYIRDVLGRLDCPAVSLACRHASRGELEPVFELDQLLTAGKTSREAREASTRIGRMLLRTAGALFANPLIDRYSAAVRQGSAYGHQAIVFGLMIQGIGLSPLQGNLVFLYNAAACMVGAAIKLIPLGQSEAQGVLLSLHPLMIETARQALLLEERDLGAFAPALDIRCMAHERLYTRLFMS